ncbi:PaaI family thioesterase [Nevskia ramosa]|uniref:PaaI family thioesterase n=1 Tax=Nevskia ramosa TaxID=64002 RepID=UPI0003B59459|nr:PaaI family thioesterase [Nevskia ramosa]
MSATSNDTAVNSYGLDAMQPLFASIPYLRKMGFEFSVDDEQLRVRLPYAEQIVGNPKVPALHGGAIGSLLQTTASVQLMLATRSLRLPRLFSCTVEYLRSARLIDVQASAVVVTRSRRFANVRATAWQDRADQPIAAATLQFVLVD